MKKRKRFPTMLLVSAVAICTICTPIFGQNYMNVYLNGIKQASPGTRVEFEYEDTKYVPLRAVAEALGYKVNFDDVTRIVELVNKDSDKKIIMKIGDNFATVNGVTKKSNLPIKISEGKTLMPTELANEIFESKIDLNLGDKINIYNAVPMSLSDKEGAISSLNYQFNEMITGKPVDYDVTIPQFSQMKDEAFQKQLNDDFVAQYKAIDAEIKELMKDQPIYAGISRYLSYDIANDKEDVLSLLQSGYNFDGGAHGMPYLLAKNIDFNKSKILTMEDIFKPSVDYKAALVKEIQKIWAADQEKYEGVTMPDKLFYDDAFYFQDGNLVIYYYPYDLAPYVYGFVKFEIPLNDLKEILKPEYQSL